MLMRLPGGYILLLQYHSPNQESHNRGRVMLGHLILTQHQTARSCSTSLALSQLHIQAGVPSKRAHGRIRGGGGGEGKDKTYRSKPGGSERCCETEKMHVPKQGRCMKEYGLFEIENGPVTPFVHVYNYGDSGHIRKGLQWLGTWSVIPLSRLRAPQAAFCLFS
ncbi:hypothetical protein VNO77_38963 [Canavalia gladiata]|uniref:Uncharacterized protein n=1 Tax=Canavalia gladiata TaxID=3824 RepID=A0AAN9K9K0_CANGL